MPYTHVWDYIPENSKNAFRAADNIFFELDLTNHRTAAALAECQLLPEDETLIDIIPRSLYRRIRRQMEYVKRKLPTWMGQGENINYYSEYQFKAMAGSWHRMKPVWLMLTLNSLTESEAKSFGIPVLDLYLSRQAVRWGKNTGAIEQVKEQCDPLNKLNHSQVSFG